MKATSFLSLSCWNNFFYNCQCFKCTVEQRRLHENHVAYRLALIHSTCSCNLQSELKVNYPRKCTNCTTPLQECHFPAPLCHAEKQQLYWNREKLSLQSSSLQPPILVDMHIMSKNFAKTLIWKHEYDVKLWRHKQRTPNTNDHHMPQNDPPRKIFCVRHCCGWMSSLSFVQRTFDWDSWNGFVCRRRCRDWGTIGPQVSMTVNKGRSKFFRPPWKNDLDVI